MLRDTIAEVAPQKRSQPSDVLFQQWPVEAQVTADLIDDFGAYIRVEVGGRRVSGRQMQDDEDQADDPDEERDRLSEPSADVTNQLECLRAVGHRSRNAGRIHQSITDTQSPRISMSTP